MGKKSILVIEDNELNMKFVKGLLQIGGYSMLEANAAETGIDMTREHPPDLILMDIQLPGMDGLSATRKILSDADLKHIPIVALTSYAMEGDKEKALAAGCTGYITKPIQKESFLNAISQYLDTGGLKP
jgi:CheY-like chemotaxis protein